MTADLVRYQQFVELLNTKFQVQLNDKETVETVLVEVSEQKLPPRQEYFSLMFRGPRNTPLGQGIRLFKHDVLGDLDVFITPIDQDDQSLYYEAVFNRIRETND